MSSSKSRVYLSSSSLSFSSFAIISSVRAYFSSSFLISTTFFSYSGGRTSISLSLIVSLSPSELSYSYSSLILSSSSSTEHGESSTISSSSITLYSLVFSGKSKSPRRVFISSCLEFLFLAASAMKAEDIITDGPFIISSF